MLGIFKADGTCATSEIVKVGNDYYYFDKNGIMKADFFLNQNGVKGGYKM